jgi:glycosyltransferase involved in cell wall biosynthesis
MGCQLTVGMPVYNGERYLQAALDGIRAQTFEDFEVVIADNASTDATRDIAEAVVAADARFRYIRRPENVGLVGNWNALFEDTESEYFHWHANDDVAAPGFYAALMELLVARPDAAASMSEICLIDGDGAEIGPDPEAIVTDHPDRAVRFTQLASFDHYCQFCYGLYRREMMARTRLMLPFFWSGDRLFLAELALQGPLLRDPRRLYYVREHGERVTDAGRANFYAGIASPQRGTALRYTKELFRAIDHAQLDHDDGQRARRAVWGWMWRNSPRLARSAGGAAVAAGVGALTRSRPGRR